MLTLLGQDSFTPFSYQILNGTADIEDLPLSDIRKKLFLTHSKYSIKSKHGKRFLKVERKD